MLKLQCVWQWWPQAHNSVNHKQNEKPKLYTTTLWFPPFQCTCTRTNSYSWVLDAILRDCWGLIAVNFDPIQEIEPLCQSARALFLSLVIGCYRVKNWPSSTPWSYTVLTNYTSSNPTCYRKEVKAEYLLCLGRPPLPLPVTSHTRHHCSLVEEAYMGKRKEHIRSRHRILESALNTVSVYNGIRKSVMNTFNCTRFACIYIFTYQIYSIVQYETLPL